MELYVVVGVWSGCLHDASVHVTLEKAREQRDSMLNEYGLTNEDVPDNQHNPECRWNDENELHLHTVETTEGVLESLYHGVERFLSHALQPPPDPEEAIHEVTIARDNVRMVMRKLGWKDQF